MTLVLAALLGVLGWTFTEYMFHRFLGHEYAKYTEFGTQHLQHHRDQDYFAPASAKAKLSVVVSVLIGLVAVPLAGWTHGVVFTASLVSSYLIYEFIHRDLHVRAPSGAYGRWARRHHMAHHHTSPGLNHGVTSPIWDIVFGTRTTSDSVRVPKAKAPVWLREAKDDRYAADYQLFGR